MLTVKDLTIKKMKSKNTVEKLALGSLISEVKGLAKKELREVNESDFFKIAKSTIKKLEKQLDIVTGSVLEDYTEEVRILKELLPKEVTEDEINSFVDDYINNFGTLSNKSIGDIMGRMKTLYGDNLNAGIASKIVRSRI